MAWRKALPGHLVFTKSELAFAAIGICDYFGVDRDSDTECEDVEHILRGEGRLVK
jgi:hypothetical protein